MRVLLIKTSSMGDLLHTLPALTDACHAYPDIRFDWVVEEAFAEIPRWHVAVAQVIPVALRRWRKQLFSQQTWQEWRALRKRLQQHQYDLVLDAQGLVKSALLTLFAKGKRVGLDRASARESLAAWIYQQKLTVQYQQHAITRMRQLMAQALNYQPKQTAIDFGIRLNTKTQAVDAPYVVFLHGTTWKTKLWPEAYWQELAKLVELTGYHIKISGGNPEEVARAKRIAAAGEKVEVLPYLTITEMASLLAHSQGAIAVDTGFGHLAAALKIPLVSIYGATNPDFTGALGQRSIHLAADFPCAPCLRKTCNYKHPSIVSPACYTTLPPQTVLQQFMTLLG